MTQAFTVDDTLGFLQTSRRGSFLPPGGRDLTISWKLAAPARVVVTIETKAGAVVRTLRARQVRRRRPVGRLGRPRPGKKRVKGGVYRAHVVARSALGTVELARTVHGPRRSPGRRVGHRLRRV